VAKSCGVSCTRGSHSTLPPAEPDPRSRRGRRVHGGNEPLPPEGDGGAPHPTARRRSVSRHRPHAMVDHARRLHGRSRGVDDRSEGRPGLPAPRSLDADGGPRFLAIDEQQPAVEQRLLAGGGPGAIHRLTLLVEQSGRAIPTLRRARSTLSRADRERSLCARWGAPAARRSLARIGFLSPSTAARPLHGRWTLHACCGRPKWTVAIDGRPP
jgi:hypothetical protein